MDSLVHNSQRHLGVWYIDDPLKMLTRKSLVKKINIPKKVNKQKTPRMWGLNPRITSNPSNSG